MTIMTKVVLLLEETNFFYSKNLMQIFIKIKDYKLWKIVTKGPHVPMTIVAGKVVEKTEDQYT